MVTSLSSTCTSLVRKSAPIVALYWLENFLFTYWFISDVLPTLRHTGSVSAETLQLCFSASRALPHPLSPSMMTFRRVRFRGGMAVDWRSLVPALHEW